MFRAITFFVLVSVMAIFFPMLSLASIDFSNPFFQNFFQNFDQSQQKLNQGLGEDPAFFYNQIREGAVGPKCLGKNGEVIDKIINCISQIIEAIKPLAALLFALAIVISGAYLIFSPANQEYIKTAKTILIWTTVGFVIIFGYDIIKDLVEAVAK